MIKIRLIILWKSALVHEMSVEELLAGEAGSFFVCLFSEKELHFIYTFPTGEIHILSSFVPLLMKAKRVILRITYEGSTDKT